LLPGKGFKKMEIINLKEALEYFDKIAEYHQEEWVHLNDGETLEKRKVRMQPYLNDEFIPTMYAAIEDEDIIGTAAIIECDLDERSDLTPWMASVYVFPAHRKKGYSKVLVKHVMKEAKRNNINKIYLYTENADELYARLGWKTISKEYCHNNEVIVMEASL
jgi:N-acetylglutamate synthase-like GNAT family acetyltransferase